mmetsp:Transcript_85924/g.208149  ORF Transcript_85924/g.208149 Transcript_85924/m.208149 type:complete len:342 (-) Transcript_85924:2396-3421(-)
MLRRLRPQPLAELLRGLLQLLTAARCRRPKFPVERHDALHEGLHLAADVVSALDAHALEVHELDGLQLVLRRLVWHAPLLDLLALGLLLIRLLLLPLHPCFLLLLLLLLAAFCQTVPLLLLDLLLQLLSVFLLRPQRDLVDLRDELVPVLPSIVLDARKLARDERQDEKDDDGDGDLPGVVHGVEEEPHLDEAEAPQDLQPLAGRHALSAAPAPRGAVARGLLVAVHARLVHAILFGIHCDRSVIGDLHPRRHLVQVHESGRHEGADEGDGKHRNGVGHARGARHVLHLAPPDDAPLGGVDCGQLLPTHDAPRHAEELAQAALIRAVAALLRGLDGGIQEV